MWDDLPSLELLRTFEIVARHQSFTGAAAELHITQAAVSHQIRTLEEFLGYRLFIRKERPISLTPEGQVLLPQVLSGLQGIKAALDQLQEEATAETLVVRVGPMFGANWLAQRIGGFYRLHPEVSLQLKITLIDTLPDFVREKLDVAVVWGDGHWEDVAVERLLPLSYTPVCSPDLLRAEQPIHSPEDLKNYPLLHGYSYDEWKNWLKRAGKPYLPCRRGPVIDDFNVVMNSAIDGQGVALCGLEMVRKHLEAGRLVQLFETTITSEEAFHLVYPESALEREVVRVFRDWLLSMIPDR